MKFSCLLRVPLTLAQPSLKFQIPAADRNSALRFSWHSMAGFSSFTVGPPKLFLLMFLDRKREMSNTGAPGIILLHLVALPKKKIPPMFPTISLEKLAAVPVYPLRWAATWKCVIQHSAPRRTAKAHRAKGLHEDRGSVLHFLAQLSPERKRFPSLRIR